MQNIAADIKRAASADAAGASKGSPTYRNATNALSLGLLDNAGLDKAANMVPGLRTVGAAGLNALRTYGRTGKAESLAGVMTDSRQAADAIEKLLAGGGTPKQVNALALEALYRGAPRSVQNGNQR